MAKVKAHDRPHLRAQRIDLAIEGDAGHWIVSFAAVIEVGDEQIAQIFVGLNAGANPDFFKGTAIETEAAAELAAAPS